MKNRKQIAKKFAKSIKIPLIKHVILYGYVARGEDTE